MLITVGIGSGAAASITERIESSGTNLLTVSGGTRGSSTSTLTMADVEVLANRNGFPMIASLAPQYSSQTTVANGSREGTYQVVGTAAAYAHIRSLDVAKGSFLPAGAENANSYVAVLGDTVATDLFGGQNPAGESVRIDDAMFQVIGVLESTGSSGFGSSDSQVYVPINVALGRLFNASRDRGAYIISSASIQVAQQEDLDAAETQVEQVLRLRHGLGTDDDNDFTISNQADLLEMASSVSGTLSGLLGGIGAVSLVEALVLCTLGGLIGIGIGYGVQMLGGCHGPGREQRQRFPVWPVSGHAGDAARPD